MPRGLGDDPLKRKRSSSTRANGVTSAQGDGSFAQQTSHNDVFFRRRSEDSQAVQVGSPQIADESPEIAEVNDIVRVAEAAQVARPRFVESPRPAINEPLVVVEAPPPETESSAAPQTEDSSEAKPEPPKSGGFFRRLFGRHGN